MPNELRRGKQLREKHRRFFEQAAEVLADDRTLELDFGVGILSARLSEAPPSSFPYHLAAPEADFAAFITIDGTRPNGEQRGHLTTVFWNTPEELKETLVQQLIEAAAEIPGVGSAVPLDPP